MSDTPYDEDYESLKEWMEQILQELESEFSSNPLDGKVKRVYFVSKSKGRDRKGRQRRRKHWKEIELIDLGYRHQSVKDSPTKRLDSVAEELIPMELVPPDITPYQFFLDCFRKLSNKKRKRG